MYIFLILLLIILLIIYFDKHSLSYYENFNANYKDPIDSNYAKIYNIVFDYKPFYENDIKNIINKTNNKKNFFLDAGCGVGRHFEYLYKKYPIIGVDKSENLLKYARIRAPTGNFIKADLSNRNLFEGNKFTHILCLSDTLYHNDMDKMDEILGNFYYWLKDDGNLCIHIFKSNKLDPGPREFSQYYKDEKNNKHALTYFNNFAHDSHCKILDDMRVKYIEKIITKNNKIKNKSNILFIPKNKNVIINKIENCGFKLMDIINLKNVYIDDFDLYIFKKIKYDNNIIKI